MVAGLLMVTTCYAQSTQTPAQYLASRPKPVFAPGHRLPHLSKFSWPYSFALRVEMATNWGYALEFANYNTLVDGGLEKVLSNSNSIPAKVINLCSNYPGRFKLQVELDRDWPTNLSRGFWVTNSDGYFVDNNTNLWLDVTNTHYTKIVSPEAPEADLRNQAASITAPLRTLLSNAPIAIILNGGERDLGVCGFDRKSWQFDPRVIAARGTNSWQNYNSERKGQHLAVLAEAVRQAVPDRELYIWYHSGNEQNRLTALKDWFNVWNNWGWRSDYIMGTNLSVGRGQDLPSFESYFVTQGSWTNRGYKFNYDLLTMHLNAVGYNANLGYRLNYSWVCGGWTTNASRLAEIPRYKGLLKCLYTSGMVGAVAGYFDFPADGFDASFPSNTPPHWLRQIEALSQVHALFSHLDGYLYEGDLLAGSTVHAMAVDQPSYEFTNTVADAQARVLARKLRASDNWIVTAWADDGPDRTVSVDIPTLGRVNVLASASGSVYRGTRLSLARLDENGLPSRPNRPAGVEVLPPESP